jgi:hypothetical protein
MSGITIVAALVRCSADLLLCNDIDTSALHFADVAECTSRLPALIDEMQRVSAKDAVVMGRCRFQLDRTPAERENSLNPSGALKSVILASGGGSFARSPAAGAALTRSA